MIRHRHLDAVAIRTAAQLLVLLTLTSVVRAQTPPPSPSPGASATNLTPTENPNAAVPPSSGEELQQITVTGYLIPRVGDGPQPVTS
jgi:hypothetical protein